MNLLDQRKAAVAAAKSIAEGAKSAGRDINAAELSAINSKLAEVDALDEKIANAKAGEELLAKIGALGPGDGRHYPDPDGPQYLDLSSVGQKSMTTRAAESMVGVVDGRKAILPVGETYLSIPTIPTDPVVIGKQPLTLLGLLPTTTIPAGVAARYLRQGTRTNNAAAVAPGDTKPTSVYGLTPEAVNLSVYAHLSEAVDRFLLEDATALAQFLSNELLYGLWQAVEKDVIGGAPVAPAPGIRGILATSGIRTEAFATDILHTTRNAIANSETLGYADSLTFVLSPADFAAAQLLQAVTSGEFLMPGAPNERPPSALWGVPVAVSPWLPVKTGLLLNRSMLSLYVDVQGVRVDWGTPGDSWSKNEVVARCEGRFDLGVLQPPAQVKIATAP